jgi:methylglutamate dehydrogenase subunit D
MAEPVTALAGLAASSGGRRATLAEVSAGTILRIQTWPETAGAVQRVTRELLGLDAPPIGEAATKDAVTLVAIAPGTFFVAGLTTDLAKLVSEALPPSEAAVTDISHGRAVMSLEGDAAAEVLQSCVTLDLFAFPPGRAAQTAIHHIDVLIHRRSETRFELWTLRSFAHALAEWLLDAGLEKEIGFRR